MPAIRLLCAACLLSLALPVGLLGQQAGAPPAPKTEERINVDRLPINLSRLERQLRQPVEREKWDGFRLNYTVEVFGAAPKLQFFEPKDVLPSGPIPYGAPTHREMVDVMTPREYRAPAADFSSFFRWLEEKLK